MDRWFWVLHRMGGVLAPLVMAYLTNAVLTTLLALSKLQRHCHLVHQAIFGPVHKFTNCGVQRIFCSHRQGADMASMQEGGWIRSEGVMTQQLLGKLQGLVALFGQADELRVNLFNDLYTMLDTRNRAILAVTASMAWLQLEAILPPYNHGVADAVL
eukprot:evm.model.scf_4003.3 EVM.evm.TU.scf_4003.3   scf_4003:8066-8536(-)